MTIEIKDLETLAEDLKESYATLAFLQKIGFEDTNPIYEEILTRVLETNLHVFLEQPEFQQHNLKSIGFIVWLKSFGHQSPDFRAIYVSEDAAQRDLDAFLNQRVYLLTSNYEIKEIFA